MFLINNLISILTQRCDYQCFSYYTNSLISRDKYKQMIVDMFHLFINNGGFLSTGGGGHLRPAGEMWHRRIHSPRGRGDLRIYSPWGWDRDAPV